MTRAIEDMSLVDHACVIPVSDEHLWEVTAGWVALGLDAGERVLYAEDDTAPSLMRRLAEDGVCVRDAISDGQLTVIPTDTTRAMLGMPLQMIEHTLLQIIDDTATQGWPGLRIAGESGPGMLQAYGLDRVVAYEELVDRVLGGSPTTRMLCRYDRRFFDDRAVAAMREVHDVELVAPGSYDDALLRVTRGPASVRLAGEIDRSNVLQVRHLLASTLDEALRSHSAPTDITLELSSLRFADVACAIGFVHAAEEFPSTHRLVLTGVRPRIVRVLDRCGAPFATQLVVVAPEHDVTGDPS